MLDSFRDFQNHANNGYSVPQMRKNNKFWETYFDEKLLYFSYSFYLFSYWLCDS